MIISVAHAATNVAKAGEHGILHDPTFWAGISFFLVVFGLYKPIKRGIITMFGVRAEKIKNKLADATKLREDTQTLLADYEKKLHNSQKEAVQIIEDAKKSAMRVKAEAKESLEKELEQREKQATNRIKMAQNLALEEIRNHVANISMEVTQKIIEDALKADKAGKLIDKSIDELSSKLKDTDLVA